MFKVAPYPPQEEVSPTLSTDAKPRAETACGLCRGAKEEDRRSMGDLGGNVKMITAAI